mgnify:CR=1 FL=1
MSVGVQLLRIPTIHMPLLTLQLLTLLKPHGLVYQFSLKLQSMSE